MSKQVAVSLGLTGRTNARVARCSTHSTKAAAAAAAANKLAETATSNSNSSSSSAPTLPKIANSSSSSSDVLEESHNSNSSTSAAAVSIDPRLESSVEWLLKHVTENYTHLQRRVAADVADMEAQFEAQKVSSLYLKCTVYRSISSHCCDESSTQHQL
jgi:hypothetical protein